jgi:hypothetical protein
MPANLRMAREGISPPAPQGPSLAQQMFAKFMQNTQAPAASTGGVDIPNGPNNSPSFVPLPAPRPASAPQDDSNMPFWMRNAYMQKDRDTNTYLDPTMASRASATSGHDIIKSMLGMFSG